MFRTCPRQLSNFFQEYLSLEVVVPYCKIRNTHRPQMMMPWFLTEPPPWMAPYNLFGNSGGMLHDFPLKLITSVFFLDNILYTHSMITKILDSTYSQEKQLCRVFAFVIVFKGSL